MSDDEKAVKVSKRHTRHKKSCSKKEKKKKKEKHRHDHKKKKKKEKDREREKKKRKRSKSLEDVGPAPPSDISSGSRSLAPMTKEQWEAERSKIKRVVDEETGRTRLVRGTGEILEEIVSRDRHREINKMATQSDGEYFQNVLSKNPRL